MNYRYFLHRVKGRKERGGLDLKRPQNDPRDIRLGGFFGNFGYNPKSQEVLLPPFSIKNQGRQNTCVCESGTGQKESDEEVELSAQWMASYLRSQNEMNNSGTSLIAFQRALNKVGIAEKEFTDNNYDLPWEKFASPAFLTAEAKTNALTHKSLSYGRSDSLEAVLQQLDAGRTGQTGLMWYDSYTSQSPFVISPFKGNAIFGHAVRIIGYKLNYQGEKVITILNSYGVEWGASGKFYVRFSDFNKVFTYGTYFNLDIPKDNLAFLSIYNGCVVKELQSPKCWFIENDRKRYIPDEALMEMLGFSGINLKLDKENVLPNVKEGTPMGLADIPPTRVQEIRELVAFSRNELVFKDRFSRYFPDLFL